MLGLTTTTAHPTSAFPTSAAHWVGYSEQLILAGATGVPCGYSCQLMVINSGNGTVTSSPSGINCGTDCIEIFPYNSAVTLTATPESGFCFGSWGGSCQGTTTATCRVSMGWTQGIAVTFTPGSNCDGNGSVITLITLYYHSILGRDPESAGLSYYQDKIARAQALGDVKPAFRQMGSDFYNSPEYLNRKTSNTDYITNLYTTFLQRTPDSGGLQFYLDRLLKGEARNNLITDFTLSPEFASFMTGLGF